MPRYCRLGGLEVLILALVPSGRDEAAIRIFFTEHFAHVIDAVLLGDDDVFAIAQQFSVGDVALHLAGKAW